MSTINISKDYLATALRKAESSKSTADVRLDALEYDRLMRASKEYDALKVALLVAGVTQDHLDTLLKSQLPHQDYIQTTCNKETFAEKNEHPSKSSPNPRCSTEAAVFVPKQPVFSPKRDFADVKPVCSIPPTPSSFRSEKRACSPVTKHDWCQAEPEYYYDDHQDRSVTLRGFSRFVTLADIASIVRGGTILKFFVRPTERSAHVAFVNPIAAENFIMYYKRNELYFKGKRIEVVWDEKQYTMPGPLQRQVYTNGATRNIVIRFAKQEMTPESVRGDLEHIHRLEIVDIASSGDHIFISTNAIQHAITARHCMRSRLKYKGTRIDFFEDECDDILPTAVKQTQKNGFEPQKRLATSSMVNRFALLFESDDEMEDKDKPMKSVPSAEEAKKPA